MSTDSLNFPLFILHTPTPPGRVIGLATTHINGVRYLHLFRSRESAEKYQQNKAQQSISEIKDLRTLTDIIQNNKDDERPEGFAIEKSLLTPNGRMDFELHPISNFMTIH